MTKSDPHPVDVHIGNRVRARRRTLGLSQTDLAEAVGVTFQQVQKYERGFNRISGSKLYDCAMALKVSPGWFYEGYSKDDEPALNGSDVMTQFACVPGAIELAAAYLSIREHHTRAHIVGVAVGCGGRRATLAPVDVQMAR